MENIVDPSPVMHEPKTQAKFDIEHRTALEKYLNHTIGSETEKFENFTKYTPRQNIARLLARYEIFNLIKDIQGSIVECGILYGVGLMSFAKLSVILEPYNFQRKIIGFDTFAGFPGVHKQDLKGDPDKKSISLKKGGFATNGAYDDLLESIRIFDINRPLNHFNKVEVVKGDFSKTGPLYIENNPQLIVSCLYLDFDIYQPTKQAIELFVPRMPKGSVIVFDELNEEQFPGETLAVLETLDIKQLAIKRFDFEPRISYAVF